MAPDRGDGTEPADEAVLCSCGALILERLGDETVEVDDTTYPFRRETDFVACSSCGTLFRVTDLRPGVNEGGEPGAGAADDALAELHALVSELESAEPPAGEGDDEPDVTGS